MVPGTVNLVPRPILGTCYGVTSQINSTIPITLSM